MRFLILYAGDLVLFPKKTSPTFRVFEKWEMFFLDQTHDAEDDGRENCREYAVGD